MNISVGKLATMGVVGSTVAGVSVAQPKTQKGEHRLNNFSTAVSLGALTALPFLTKEIVSTNQRSAVKVAQKAGQTIEKAIEYGKQAVNSQTAKKVVKAANDTFNLVKSTAFGKKVIDKIGSVVKKVVSNKTVQNVVSKAAGALEKFAKSPTTKKGKIGLIAAGVALLAYAGFKTVTNFYKKEGAIDQKYDDLHKKYERMLAIDPITNARTGEPISFEQYCKYAQTMLK